MHKSARVVHCTLRESERHHSTTLREHANKRSQSARAALQRGNQRDRATRRIAPYKSVVDLSDSHARIPSISVVPVVLRIESRAAVTQLPSSFACAPAPALSTFSRRSLLNSRAGLNSQTNQRDTSTHDSKRGWKRGPPLRPPPLPLLPFLLSLRASLLSLLRPRTLVPSRR